MSKRRQYRARKRSDDDDDDEEETVVTEKLEDSGPANVRSILEERKELQKFRQRQKGVSAEDLAGMIVIEKPKEKDPFNLKTGGLVQMTEVRSLENVDDEVRALGPAFSTETNQLDEDVQMLRYIDDEIKKKRGTDADTTATTVKTVSKEDLLYELPDEINVKSKILRSEEMLSAAMLSGIPEVDLGIEAKIKNIEETENARIRLLEESKNVVKASVFVPTNMAANFLHHSRFVDEQKALERDKRKEQAKKRETEAEEVRDVGPTVGCDIVENSTETAAFMQKTGVGGGGGGGGERKRQAGGADAAAPSVDKKDSSDDYHLERFKKKSRGDVWRQGYVKMQE